MIGKIITKFKNSPFRFIFGVLSTIFIFYIILIDSNTSKFIYSHLWQFAIAFILVGAFASFLDFIIKK